MTLDTCSCRASARDAVAVLEIGLRRSDLDECFEVVYVAEDGAEQRLPWQQMPQVGDGLSPPVRSFPSYRGQRARDERNNVAHHLRRDLHGNAAELFYIADAAYWFFIITMMREAKCLKMSSIIFERTAD